MTALFDSAWYEDVTRFAAATGWMRTPVVLFTTYGLLLHRRLGVIAVVAALAMAASRVYVGAHYPHDVVMGLLVGAIVATALGLAARTLLAPLVGDLRRGPLRPLLSRSG